MNYTRNIDIVFVIPVSFQDSTIKFLFSIHAQSSNKTLLCKKFDHTGVMNAKDFAQDIFMKQTRKIYPRSVYENPCYQKQIQNALFYFYNIPTYLYTFTKTRFQIDRACVKRARSYNKNNALHWYGYSKINSMILYQQSGLWSVARNHLHNLCKSGIKKELYDVIKNKDKNST